MINEGKNQNRFIERHFLIVILIIITLSVFILTLVSINKSRSDSFKLMIMEGMAFIETLTSSAKNAMSSENFYDYLVHKRYQEIVIELSIANLEQLDETSLSRIAVDHDLYSIFVYDIDSQLVTGTIIKGANLNPPDYVYNEIKQLIANPEDNYILLLNEGEQPDEVVHYYMEITNKLDRVILLVADAYYYLTALKQTEISYLASEMAREPGVEYIIYQIPDSVIFTTKRTSDVMAATLDPFLISALDSDTVMYRRLAYNESEILEMVRPFANVENPNGLLRVGLSLKNYNLVVQGFDRQMITLAVILFSLIIVIILYINSRTKRKEITKEYQKIKSISDKIFEEMKTGVAAVNKNGQIYLANNAFVQIVGSANSDQLNWDDCLSQKDLSFENLYNRVDDNYEVEYSIDTTESKKIILLAVSKIYNNINQPEGFVAVISDITRLKELEQQTAQRERLSEMGNLAAGVAHEIRNPLNSISIASQRLAAEFKPNENREEYISFTNQIKNETKRLNEIITKFLALTRKEKDKQNQFDLKSAILNFIKLITPEADNLKININNELEDNLLLNGSPDSFKQVLSNLYNNSKEAFESKAGTITIKSYKQNNDIVIEFSDTGPGIEDNIRQKVFTPYYTTKKAGTGLGLPTVYRIITEMGGDIKIESSETPGVRFVMSFKQ